MPKVDVPNQSGLKPNVSLDNRVERMRQPSPAPAPAPQMPVVEEDILGCNGKIEFLHPYRNIPLKNIDFIVLCSDAKRNIEAASYFQKKNFLTFIYQLMS